MTLEEKIDYVSRNGLLMKELDKLDKKNPNIVINAIVQNSMSLRYADDTLKDDYQIVEKAVRRNGSALKYASNRLIANRTICIMAVLEDYEALAYVDPELRNDDDIMRAYRESKINHLERFKMLLEQSTNEALRDMVQREIDRIKSKSM